ENGRIGEVINHDGLQFSIVPRTGEEGSTFSKTRTVQINIVPVGSMATYYSSSFSICPKGQAADILSLGIIQPEGRKSEDFLNNLMYEVNEDGVADKRQVAGNTTEFIQERLALITQELDSVEGGLADFKRENQFMDVLSGAQEFQLKSNMAEQQIFDIELQLSIIRSVESRLNSGDDYTLLPLILGSLESKIAAPITTYNTLVLQRNA